MTDRWPERALLTVDDLPRLIAAVAQQHPKRPALVNGDTEVVYGALHAELETMDAAMGGVLGPDALVPVVLSNLVPALLESAAEGGIGEIVQQLIDDAADALGFAGVGPRVAPPATLVDAFEQQLERTPGAIALEYDGHTLTYREFGDRVHRMARHLVEHGVGPDTLVGLGIRRSIDLLVAMYAIVEAGGAYVPIDPDHPLERIAHVLEAARPVAIVTTTADRFAVPDGVEVLEVDRLDVSGYSPDRLTDADRVGALRPENLAYVIFTSGSTGLPKGVGVSHAAIVANLLWRQAEYGFTSDDVVLQKTPLTFDVSVWEFFWPLQIGARLLIAKPGGHMDPAYLARTIVEHGVTVAHFVPSMLAIFVIEPAAAQVNSLRLVFASGEALPAQTVARFYAISDAVLHNLYGPTEAAVDVTYYETRRGDELIPIGVAVPGTDLVVLDERLRSVPEGVAGELYLAGVQLARCYVGRPDISSDRFVANPLGGRGSRMYRTGDLVRRRAGGVLEYLGRTDFQVKLRGLRIELGEIESVLLFRDDVRHAVAVVNKDSPAGDLLVAYVITDSGKPIDEQELAATARAHLPDYMVPSVFVHLDRLPLGPSGKLDRKALPAPNFESRRHEYRPPETPSEEGVAEVFADLLDVDQIGADDDFFELGGNSLVAARAIARINSRMAVRLEVHEFFDSPTVSGLAVLVDKYAEQGSDRPPLVPQQRPERVPLSLAQQRMWFLNRFQPESAAYNIPIAVRLSGLLDRHALQIAVADVLARHDVLRTYYPEIDGVGYQVMVPTSKVIPDLSPEPVSEADLVFRITDVATATFDVTAGVPFRAALFEVSATEHVLVVVVHHISADGFSLGPLARDVVVAYAARSDCSDPDWQPLAVQYADYALWQRALLGSADDKGSLLVRQLDYWETMLRGAPDVLALPTDRPRPAVASNRGRRVDFQVDAGLHNALLAIARERGVTLFMVVHAALAALLARMSGSTDIAIGTPIAGRGEAALDDLVGMFVNTLVLRSEVEMTQPFSSLLARVRDIDLGAFGHVDVPFESVVEKLNPVRSQSYTPFFQVSLTFQNLESPHFELPGLSISAIDMNTQVTQFDLDFVLTDHYVDGLGTGIGGILTFAADLFDDDTADRIVACLLRVLKAVGSNVDITVGDIDLLSAKEREQIVHEWNSTDVAIPDETLVELFDQRVPAFRERPAVVFEGEQLTYAEFASKVRRLARWMVTQGIGPDSVVALAFHRSFDLAVSVHAVLHAGGAFLPLDPDLPVERLLYVAEVARPALVLATSGSAPDLPDVVLLDKLDLTGFDDAPIAAEERTGPLRPDNLAYVIFTSGSTGRPKGVATSHGAIVNQLEWMSGFYGLDETHSVVQKTPVTFDVSVWELLLPLQIGAKLTMARPDGHRDPAYLTQLLADAQVTILELVPSMLAAFVADSSFEPPQSLVYMLSGGEALVGELAARVVSNWTASLDNVYGPAEVAIGAASHRCVADERGAVPIGGPLWNTKAYVLDARMRPVPIGVPGELYLAGVQLARGYLSRPTLTADRFVADPFGGAGGRMYRTGDLVRWTGRGEMIYVGRSDFQVKIRGQRIELGEIESVLRLEPTVENAVVVAHKDANLGEMLVAYLVPTRAATIDVEQVSKHVGRELPAFMSPSVFMVLEELPITANGKLDRPALPQPEVTQRPFRAPSTPIEEIVAGVFSEVLRRDRVGADDDFFASGGNSLSAMQVVARIGVALDTRIQVRELFETSTVAGLAARLETHTAAGDRIALAPRERPKRVPLSLAQQRMWFLNRFDPESTAYNLPIAIRLVGRLDTAALAAAVADLVQRHEVLRTVYPESTQGPVQVVVPAAQVIPDLTPIHVAPEDVLDTVGAFVSRGFDVTTEVPVRAALYSVSADEHVLALVIHHVSADGASDAPLTRDVMSAYLARAAGQEPGWIPLPVQYADFALWQRDVLGSEDDPESLISQQLTFWRDTLTGAPDLLELPTDRSRPAVQSFAGSRVGFDIDADLHRRLADYARTHNATLFMVVHAAFAVLLARLSRSDDISVGTPIAGRGEQVLDDLIGMFVNTLVFRTVVNSGESFDGLLARVREIDLSAFANADVPFERLVEVLNPPRSQARHPLFQVGFSFQNLAPTSFELPGLTVSGVDVEGGTSQFDLHLVVADSYDESGVPSGMTGVMTYATALFDELSVQAFVDRFLRLLPVVVAESQRPVGDLDLLDSAERIRVLDEWNDTTRSLDAGATLVSLFDAQVAAAPTSPALIADELVLTYGEFDARVNCLARWLISQGVGAEARVGLAIGRSVELLVAMFAVAKTGASYVPVDPDAPEDRVRQVLDSAAPTMVISTTRDAFTEAGEHRVVLLDSLDLTAFDPRPVLDDERVAPLRAANTAYLIFTSGSTGRPKGVAVSHGAVVNQLVWKQAEFGLGADDAALLKTAATFDLSVWEFWSALTSGGRLVIADRDGHRDPHYLLRLLRDHSVTTLHIVPSMLAMLTTVAAGAPLAPSLRHVLAIGEALSAAAARAFRAANPTATLYNLYGPTEATVSITTHTVDDADITSVPIGSPEWNSKTYVLDSRLQPVPAGVLGELYLAGAQLARGYFGRPDLTAERFVADPFGAPGTRAYRTGDLVRWTAAGELEYVGRTDFQVKVRGFRIELGEIEAVLRSRDDIADTAVIVRVEPRLGEQLVGYVVPEEGTAVEPANLENWLSGVLPGYMVPQLWVVLDRLPLNSNGKLDRAALPAPVVTVREFRAPSTPVEQVVAAVFAELLGVERVGVDDDFFALGGNSLIATQATARLGAALETTVPVRYLFEAPTVAAFATKVESGVGTGGRPALSERRRPDLVPLSLAQQRMWILNRLDPGSAAYNIPVAIRMSGTLDTAALQAAIADVIERHEILRTRFPDIDGIGRQEILAAPERTLQDAPAQVPESELLAWVTDAVTTGFDVAAVPPVRVQLAAVQDVAEEHVLVLVVHHIAFDGLSAGPLTRDLIAAYAARSHGEPPRWKALPVQYADYTLWQYEVLGAEGDPDSLINTQLNYWRTALAALPDLLELPTDRSRPPTMSYRGATHVFSIPAVVHADAVRVARQAGATVFMVVQAALSVLLARLSGNRDIAVGTPIGGRGEPQLDDLVGMFVNTLVLRVQVEPAATFAEVLEEVRRVDLGAFGHADVPFERVVEAIDPVRSQAHSPLFQVALGFVAHTDSVLELPGMTVRAVDFDEGVAKFDLQLTVAESVDDHGLASGLEVETTYATDLFDAATIKTFGERFARVLAAVVADPMCVVGDIDALAADERARLLGSEGAAAEPGATLPCLLEAAVAAAPDGPAVVFSGREWSYSELDRESSRLARLLIAEGIGPEDRVAVSVPRSRESVLAWWSVAKSGAAFVPIDPNYPTDRVEYMIADSGVTFGLTTRAFVNALPGAVAWHALDDDAFVARFAGLDDGPVAEADRTSTLQLGNAVYVIYTSGSTGRPKGVVVTHAGIANLAAEQRERFTITRESRVLHVASPSFDASFFEWLMAIGSGAALVVSPPDVFGGGELAELLRTQRVTHAVITPGVLTSLDPTDFPALQLVLSAGEALGGELASRWAAQRSLLNGYGPTETTVMSNCTDALVPDAPVAIGGPVRGMRTLILDERLQPVPSGVAGELYIAGIQLARGYHGRASLTSERFVADPYGPPGARIYRTGDVVRWRTGVDGTSTVEYVGRTDFQVKVRGFRIELGEIDAALAAHPDVEFAVTLGRAHPTGTTMLVSYVLPSDGSTVDTAQLSAYVAESLPAHMVPAAIIVLDRIPLTPIGKLDRAALPEPVLETVRYRAPVTPVEEIVADVFADVLGVARVGLDDDFFALGGNSLIAMQVVGRLGKALDTTVPLRALFDSPTVTELSVAVESAAGSGGAAELVAIEPRPERIPLSLAQQRIWFLNRLDPESGAYNIPLAIRLTGELSIDALRLAVADVVARHETLRTRYPASVDGPRQEILHPADAVPVVEVEDVDTVALPIRVIEVLSRGFDVTTEVPLRIRVFRVNAAEHVLVVAVHHISADGFSMGPLTRDVMLAYSARNAGELPQWRPLPVQYADFSVWQREMLGSEQDPESILARQLEYWRTALSGLPDQLNLPTDRPRRDISSEGGLAEFAVSAEQHESMVALARSRNSSLFMVVHAALSVLLSRLSGTHDIAVGTGSAGRGQRALDDLVGMFVNTLVLRTQVDAAISFAELVDRTRESDLSAFANADVPFEQVVEALKPNRSPARQPFFQVMLAFQDFTPVSFELPSLTVSGLDSGEVAAKFDLQLEMEPRYSDQGTPAGLAGAFTYATDLFDASTVDRFAERLVRIIETVTADPSVIIGDIDILGVTERELLAHAMTSKASDSESPVGVTLPQLLGSTVEADPEALAFLTDGAETQFAELDSYSSRIARFLLARKIEPGSRVGVRLEPSVQWAAAMWGVLKSGAAVVPLAVGDDIAVTIVLDAELLDDSATDIDALSGRPVTYTDLARPVRPDDPAFVLVADGVHETYSHARVASAAAGLARDHDIDYESTLLCAGTSTGAAQFLTTVIAAETGAAIVVSHDARAEDLTELVTGEEITHVIVDRGSVVKAGDVVVFEGDLGTSAD